MSESGNKAESDGAAPAAKPDEIARAQTAAAEEEEKVVEEKVIKVNLRHAYLTYGRKAAPKAVRLVKKVASKAFKTEDVKISAPVNETLWQRGKTKTARKIALRVQKLESGIVRVLVAEA